MKSKEFSYRVTFYSYLGGFILFIFLMLFGCDCYTQIPTQYYFANDSCEFYLPDYSQSIEVRDNCCVEGFIQTPNSGTRLTPGNDITVTLTAIDCAGNTSTMSFEVIVIDKIPPTFYYDSTEFLPLGMYQNDTRTYHFWTDSEIDTTLTDPPIYYSQDKTARDRTVQIGESISDATYNNTAYYKMSLFMAQSTYRVIDMYMALAKIGQPEGKFNVEIWQLNMIDTSLLFPVCGTQIDINEIHTRISSSQYDVQPSELIWNTVNVSDGVLIRGGWYAIRTYCTGVIDSDNRVIWNTTNYDYQDRYKFLKYSYDSEVTYGVNNAANYMYQIFGTDLI